MKKRHRKAIDKGRRHASNLAPPVSMVVRRHLDMVVPVVGAPSAYLGETVYLPSPDRPDLIVNDRAKDAALAARRGI